MNVDELISKAAMLEAQVTALTQRLEQQEQAHRALAAERDLLRAAFEVMPVGVAIVDASDQVHVHNAKLKTILGDSSTNTDYEIFLPDGITEAPRDREPTQRALHGHAVDELESVVRNPAFPEQPVWIVQSAEAIRDEDGNVRACVVVTRDVTEHKELVRELDEVVAATVEEKRVLIERLEAGVKELSTPIIEVWDDVLTLPVIGTVDERRGADMTARVLDEVVARGTRCVIIDWTGVETLDGQSAQHLLDLVRSVELVGAECILTGIRPAVASALLNLDVRFEHLRLLRNVKFGLRYCLGRLQPKSNKPKTQSKPVRSSSSSTH